MRLAVVIREEHSCCNRRVRAGCWAQYPRALGLSLARSSEMLSVGHRWRPVPEDSVPNDGPTCRTPGTPHNLWRGYVCTSVKKPP